MFGLPGGGIGQARRQGQAFVNSKSTSFNGLTQYVSLGQPSNMAIVPSSDEITLCWWGKPTSLVALQYMLTKARPFVPNITCLAGVNTDGTFFGYFGGTANTSSPAGVVVVDTWNLFGWTLKNVSGTLKGQLHCNGVHVSVNFDATAGSDTASGLDWVWGGSRNSNNTDIVFPFTGRMKDLTVWNTPFSDTDHSNLYNAGTLRDPRLHSKVGNLIHWWRGGDGTGDSSPTIKDQIGSNDATMVAMSGANFVTDAP